MILLVLLFIQFCHQLYESIVIYIGADFYQTNRGGLITFHGPGQLIAYPIINLKHYKTSIRWYISQIENVIVNVCQEFGLEATTTSDTGVWIGNNKVLKLLSFFI